ncbi:hypothetical protein P7K49_014525 [Saguinus oedipus]|uniref:EGF-like domain-containing protein n=1 Tax=Saguinus oedipus TaxID=9490 RepID=A0ABQ9VJN3_SAGOE|nr:hypothetical protein P7K49_014525 [Saguinus oedipus]
MDDCVEHACANGGICMDTMGNYTCQCPLQYKGRACEQLVELCSPYLNPCQHEAQCVGTQAGPRCECVPGYTGDDCSKNQDDCRNHRCQSGAQCVNEFADLQNWHRANITLQVSMVEDNGFLPYNRNNDHIAVELYQGHVHVSYHPGSYPSSAIYSAEMINSTVPHCSAGRL